MNSRFAYDKVIAVALQAETFLYFALLPGRFSFDESKMRFLPRSHQVTKK